MRWLFLFFVFDVTANAMQPQMRLTAVYQNEDECNRLGQELANRLRYQSAARRSFSICIPESAYDATQPQVERYDQ